MSLAILTAQIGNYHNARYTEFVKCGIDFTVLAVQNEGEFAKFLSTDTEGYAVRRVFGGRVEYLQACKKFEVWRIIQSKLDEINPEVVAVAGWATPESFSAIDWAKRNKKGIIVFSDSQRIDAERRRWREKLKSRIVSLCDAALVAGPSHAQYAIDLGIAENRIFLGYDVVDNDFFKIGAAIAKENSEFERARLKLPSRYILASARFVPKKNLLTLIRAFANAARALNNETHLVLLGDGPERKRLESEIERNELDDIVHLMGFKSYSDLPSYYGLAECFVHIATTEQWGLVINEAAASGLPIIASNSCGATECLVKHGQNGIAVNATDEMEVKDALVKVLTSSPEKLRRMRAASKAAAADWGLNRFALSLSEAYEAAKRAPKTAPFSGDRALLRLLARKPITRVQ